MSCKRGGFVTIRHNDWPDLTAKLLNNVCNDVEIEPKLLPVTGEIFLNRTPNTPNKDWILDQGSSGLEVNKHLRYEGI